MNESRSCSLQLKPSLLFNSSLRRKSLCSPPTIRTASWVAFIFLILQTYSFLQLISERIIACTRKCSLTLTNPCWVPRTCSLYSFKATKIRLNVTGLPVWLARALAIDAKRHIHAYISRQMAERWLRSFYFPHRFPFITISHWVS